MRSAAFLLLLSLIGPPVTTAACDFRCVHVHQHEPAAVSKESCHDDIGTEAATLLTAVSDAACHETSGKVAAVLPIAPSVASPAAEQPSRAFWFARPSEEPACVSTDETSSPPGISPVPTQLRI